MLKGVLGGILSGGGGMCDRWVSEDLHVSECMC